ncbi:MAG: hypothetical protein ACOY3K_06400 [Candidatus Omnitrophota bacterium]
MFCDFCGRNFEPREGFEQIRRKGRRFVRCEHCHKEAREEFYDWRTEIRNRGSRGSRRPTH